MYSTKSGAKKRAKSLQRMLSATYIELPLHACHTAMAVAGGYRDWHHLQSVPSEALPAINPRRYRERLLGALPHVCRAPAGIWLDEGERNGPFPADEMRFFRFAYHHWMAATKLHRARTPLVRKGSGRGQQARELIVVGALLNMRGGHRPPPMLDAETLAFKFAGSLEDLYGVEAVTPQFMEEFKKLETAGIVAQKDGAIVIMAPDGVEAAAIDDRTQMAEYRQRHQAGMPDAEYELQSELASIGIANAGRVALAVMDQGSAAYLTDSGAALTLLSELAAESELQTFAQAVRIFRAIRPQNAAFVTAAVPAKIMSRYFPANLPPTRNIERWALRHPDWPKQLTDALANPAGFARTAEAMLEEIRNAA